MRRTSAVLALMVTAGVAALSASAPARAQPLAAPRHPGSFGVRLVLSAAEAVNPRAKGAIIDVLRPGMTIHRRIEVVNDEPRRAVLTVYAAAAVITGGTFIGKPGKARSELTGWVTVRHPVVRLPPYSSTLDRVTITVPRIATSGQQYGVIWVQQAAAARPRQGMTIQEVNRVGIRIYLAISRGARPMNFVISSLTARRPASGPPEIIAHVDNTGGQAVDVSGTARLTQGPGGTSAGSFLSTRTVTLAPGQSGNVVFLTRRGLPSGPWHVRVRLASGLDVRTASATLSFSGGTARALTLALGSGGILAALALAGTVAVRRTRRPRRFRLA